MRSITSQIGRKQAISIDLDKNLLFCAPVCTQRCAGEEELLLALKSAADSQRRHQRHGASAGEPGLQRRNQGSAGEPNRDGSSLCQ